MTRELSLNLFYQQEYDKAFFLKGAYEARVPNIYNYLNPRKVI